MITSLISHGTERYATMVDLRKRILRDPLGLVFTEKDLEGDKKDLLCGCYNDNGQLIGTCILTRIDDDIVQLRQMAIEPSYQGKGIGNILLQYAERTAMEHHYKKMILHARKTAVGFYEKTGYKVVGKEFIEVGIPHFEMDKQLFS